MKMKPILFSTPMVQAILSGNKTMTRRVVKHKCKIEDLSPMIRSTQNENDWDKLILTDENGEDFLIEPKYKVGDVLWVRETYNTELAMKGEENEVGKTNFYVYKADAQREYQDIIYKWKPSIFMPREAARLFLKVTEVRVERLQDISEEAAISEGVSRYPKSPIYGYKNYCDETNFVLSAKESFETLWKKINGETSWNENPYVWVIGFERIDKPNN